MQILAQILIYRKKMRHNVFRNRVWIVINQPQVEVQVVCQLCGKNNHATIQCYHRFDITLTGRVQNQASFPHNSHRFDSHNHSTHILTLQILLIKTPLITLLGLVIKVI